MTTQRTAIFRAEAIRHHEQCDTRPASPQLALSRAVPFLWGLLGLLIVSGLAFWFTLATKQVLGE